MDMRNLTAITIVLSGFSVLWSAEVPVEDGFTNTLGMKMASRLNLWVLCWPMKGAEPTLGVNC
jgi:hypothetical protein